MSDIHIRRDHTLGLARARKVAWKWAEAGEAKLDLQCTVIEGDTSDTVEFKRAGASGQMIVTADHFELNVKLGFLLKAFAGKIEQECVNQLEGAIAKEQAKEQAKQKAAKA